MNIKHILTVTTIAFAAAGAQASEITEFTDIGGSLSRAEVKAELAQAQANGNLTVASEIYGQVEPVKAIARSRDEVRAEARMEARNTKFDPLYDGA